VLMSLWSFQGARELETSPPAEITAVAGNADTPISQNSTAHWPIASPK
jgi:hypothetical protein